ncbi:alpha-amylase family glycosyl hydrolase [Granulicella tundricola]|uniref:Alpha amylase catalytic region n=1 Tax=Granulicella tundricola (strain ATCC BAA-1859 / DSM 23138 / MP5ACTX9) TaxID=1198114 RepID=E8WXZ1_GRATM|nr:alpha-amylase family glycosyl hydrolase [Granulicella tundricola]ADW67530.1 alpha amylase catalytic region [Granulicella tundricola MP5ACTX9]
MSEHCKLWWRDGVIYQIYPRSFQDSNGDGVGDLAGISSRLDYVATLGVDAIWISPFYPSPMADFGYDVADYTGVDPLFGTIDDFDALLAGAHARNLKVILDFVPNHTSDQHPWFLESRSSRDNPKRDWYLWRDGNEGRVPNNWMSNFGGTAWTYDEITRQFYYHSFLTQQPDLNWRNPEVRAAIFAAMRFWLDKGVDGFRMDVLWLLIKDDQFRSNPPNPDFNGGSSFWSILPTYTADQPETHEIVRQMRALVDEYSERVLIGEIYLPIDELVRYYEPGDTASSGYLETPHLHGAQLPFNFHLIQTAWQADLIAELIRSYEAALPPGAWPNWVLGNHDQHRLATRIGAAQARVAAMLILTLRGTPTLYYGDELGMTDATITPDQVQDPAEKNQPGQGFGRDPERSPMLWDETPNAGFTSAPTPWLPLVDEHVRISVTAEEAAPRSFLHLYRALLTLRSATPALHCGTVTEVISPSEVLTYTRAGEAERYQIHLNFTNETKWIDSPKGTLILSTYLDQQDRPWIEWMQLRPNEGVVIKLNESPQ